MVAPPRVLQTPFLLLFATAAFGLSLAGGFVFDDPAIFTADSVSRPLVWATFALNETVSGTNPFGFHLLNLVLHLAAVWLLRDALRGLLPERAAGIAALLFAVHPIQAGAVAYIWARSTLLMTVFCLLSLQVWVRGRHWLAVLWFVIALAAKVECVAFPVFLGALHLSVSRNRAEWKPLAAMFGAAAAAGGYIAWLAAVTPGSQAGAQSLYAPGEYLASQGLVILRYLQLLVVPFGFTADPAVPAGWWWAWVPVLGIAAWALRSFRGAGPGFWFLAGLLLLLPSSSIFPADDLAADRRMYLPVVAFAASAGLLLRNVSTRWLMPPVLLLTALSMHRAWVWGDEGRLWSEALWFAPEAVRPRIHLARTLPPEQALPLLQEARKLAPENALVASETGRVLLTLQRTPEALAEFGRALALAPNQPQALSNRGVALLMLGQADAARADFLRARALEPCAFEPVYNLRRMGERVDVPPECRFTDWEQQSLQSLP